MGHLILVVGNAGVGKTTLVQQLCQHGDFVTGLEQISERPFQALFAHDLQRYALPNQIDYLLLRAEQELAIRQSTRPGLQDGGLETDFYVFNQRFYQRGYLTDAEFSLCQRFYNFVRATLPPPDLIIQLVAPLEIIAERYRRRNRPLEIAKLTDLAALNALLDQWLTHTTIPIVTVDASTDDPTYATILPTLLATIAALPEKR